MSSATLHSFSSEAHSANWWWAAIISTIVPLIYVLMGGLKSSLYSDVLQACMFIIGLIIDVYVLGSPLCGERG